MTMMSDELMALLCRRADGVLSREIGDSIFLSHEADSALFRLNPVGAAVWRLIATPHSIGDIVSIFTEAFPDRPLETIQGDLMALIENLRQRNLVVTTPP